MYFFHPGPCFYPVFRCWWIDQFQSNGATLGARRELVLILHDEIQTLCQFGRAEPIPETETGQMLGCSMHPAIAYQVTIAPCFYGPDF